MNRNTELHFSNVPKIHTQRSKFDLSHSVKTSFNAGEVIPLYTDADIMPGDTVQMDMASVIRMSTPLYPTMDNAIMDVYAFFVPHRLVWEHWKAFWGENDNPWIQNIEYEIPQIEAPSGGWTEGTIADYMGVPTKVDGISINALPFRAYAKVWNDWFRDENLKSNCNIYKDETTRTGTNSGDYVTNTELGALPCKVAKLHDYFTSSLPSPQKGPAVTLPLGDMAPVKAWGDKSHININDKAYGVKFGSVTNGKYTNDVYGTVATQSEKVQVNNIEMISNQPLGPQNTNMNALNVDSEYVAELATEHNYALTPNNLWTDLNQATAATINELRTAFAIQKYYEAAGRNGTRYIEYLRSVFGVESSDARVQRSEYLGGYRTPINIDQVLQTSATDNVSPQGHTAAFSCTINNKSLFTKSFEEHGTLLVLGCVRTEHTYQQGLAKMWSRKKWTDFYNPYFANLGEMAILNKEIYCQGPVEDPDNPGTYLHPDEEAFGYQEAWAEYRYKNNIVTGEMRSNATTSLDAWHYADDYNAKPTLSSTWIDETKDNIDRTLAVTSAVSNQIIGDFYNNIYYTRPMPVYSVPGLIDHV